ncbi:hypothetical protein L873DRAFT_595285 [Choiromyces venosus 120613-1]|uniref:Uncharacterized protein n=1 Tax=Choiromyces venosus 120613-1 TaxID=1336337 RepID=A0A3N4JTN7_9PEZI|nr:hypothetical protein L873DRAFT_595285 [Choiromyces venosus 120613-1]
MVEIILCKGRVTLALFSICLTLIPFDKDIVLYNIPNPNSPPHTPHCEPQEDLPPPGHLDRLTAEEMTQSSTPTTIRQLRYQEHLLQGAEWGYHSNSLQGWKRHTIFNNIAHAAHHSMLQAEDRKHEITTILVAERREREKRKRKRQRIPAEGRPWLDQSDINEFFANQEEERIRKAKAKEERIEKAIGRQHTLLREVERKRVRAAEHEQQSTLLRTWKTSYQHEQEQKKLEKKLAALLEEQRSLPPAGQNRVDSSNRFSEGGVGETLGGVRVEQVGEAGVDGAGVDGAGVDGAGVDGAGVGRQSWLYQAEPRCFEGDEEMDEDNSSEESDAATPGPVIF